MAAILRTGGFLRILSGIKWSPHSYKHNEVTRILKLHTPAANLPIVRSYAAEAPLESLRRPPRGSRLERELYFLDGQVRRFGMISKKAVDAVIANLTINRYATSGQCLMLIRCCGSLIAEEAPEVRNQIAHGLWNKFLEYEIPLDISHYNALLKVYLENEHNFSPSEFLSTLEQNDIEPNRVTYQRLISHYCQDGDIEGSSKVLEYMKDKGLPVNEAVFNALITGHARANDLESAHGVLAVMEGAGLEPSSDTYTKLMAAYAEKGDIEAIKNVLKKCEADDVGLYNQNYLEVIFALCKSGHGQHMQELVGNLENRFGYQYDVKNSVYRLLNAGCDDAAYQLFSTVSLLQTEEGNAIPTGTYFLLHLIKSGKFSLETVVKYCQKMKTDGINLYGLERMTHHAILSSDPDTALALLRAMVENNVPVRRQYFWPLICLYSRLGAREKVYHVLQEMMELNVRICHHTCSRYVIPQLNVTIGEEPTVINTLKVLGISVTHTVNSFVRYYLGIENVAAAAALLRNYPVKIQPPGVVNSLAKHYVNSREAEDTAVILGQMWLHMTDAAAVGDDAAAVGDDDAAAVGDDDAAAVGDDAAAVGDDADDDAGDDADDDEEKDIKEIQERSRPDVVGRFLLAVVKRQPRVASSTLEPILKVLERRGITISNETVTELQEIMGNTLTGEVSELLRSLSGNLIFEHLPYERIPPSRQTVEISVVNSLKKADKHSDYICKRLLTYYISQNDVENVEKTKKKLDEIGCPLTTPHYGNLINMYASIPNLEKALDTYKEVKTRIPDYKMVPHRVLTLASVMISEGQIKEVLKLLEDNAPTYDNNSDIQFFRSVDKVIRAMGTCDVSQIKQIIDKLLGLHYVVPSQRLPLHKPLVEVMLQNDDIAGALEAFESIAMNHRYTVVRTRMLEEVIKREDTEKLQKIMDVCIENHGELSSLYDLTFAFLMCGKVKQARKIVQTPGFRAMNSKLDYFCRKLCEDLNVECLKNLIAITKDVYQVDRSMMMSWLLKCYKVQGESNKALGLWTAMQEDDVRPSDSFLMQLGQYLQAQGLKVPFLMPTEDARMAQEKNRLFEVGKVIADDDQSDLTLEVIKNMVLKGKYPKVGALKDMLIHLAENGKVDDCLFFSEYLDKKLKLAVQYDLILSNAYVTAGRAEEFLDYCISAFDKSEKDATTFRVGPLMNILSTDKTLLPKVKEQMQKDADCGSINVANCVWMHLMIEGCYEEAREVFDKYLKHGKRAVFGDILRHAKVTSNVECVSELTDALQTSSWAGAGPIGKAYSNWIQILCTKELFQEGLNVFEEGMKHSSIDKFHTETLERLKEGLRFENKTIPDTLTEERDGRKATSNNSSSSSVSDSN